MLAAMRGTLPLSERSRAEINGKKNIKNLG
jgi:hypothetical protein